MSTFSAALYQRRRIINAIAITLACAAAVFGLVFLGWILWTLVAKGLAHLNLALFLQDQPPPMEAGGLRNAIVGSLLMCGMGVAIGTPISFALLGLNLLGDGVRDAMDPRLRERAGP